MSDCENDELAQLKYDACMEYMALHDIDYRSYPYAEWVTINGREYWMPSWIECDPLHGQAGAKFPPWWHVSKYIMKVEADEAIWNARSKINGIESILRAERGL